MWRDVTRGVAEDPNCLVSCHTTGILKVLQGMSGELEVIERALEQYLETKRQFFPRFYFISNDILLEILGCSKNPPEVRKMKSSREDDDDMRRLTHILKERRTVGTDYEIDAFNSWTKALCP